MLIAGFTTRTSYATLVLLLDRDDIRGIFIGSILLVHFFMRFVQSLDFVLEVWGCHCTLVEHVLSIFSSKQVLVNKFLWLLQAAQIPLRGILLLQGINAVVLEFGLLLITEVGGLLLEFLIRLLRLLVAVLSCRRWVP